jgi:hypothetical protein
VRDSLVDEVGVFSCGHGEACVKGVSTELNARSRVPRGDHAFPSKCSVFVRRSRV